MIQEHLSAVIGRISQGPLEGLIFDSQVTDTTGSPVSRAEVPDFYAVIFGGSPAWASERLLATQTRADFDYTLHSVGHSPEQARFVANHLTTRILGFVPTIAGRRCWPITVEASQPVRPDNDTSPALYFAVDVIRLSSIPA